MRVTERLNIENLLTNFNRMKELQAANLLDLATGKRLHKSSDDPFGTEQVLGLNKVLTQVSRYQKNIDDAKLWLNLTEASLNAISESVNDARAIASEAAGSMDSQTLQIVIDQVQDILESVVSDANQKSGNRYLFGGTALDSPPFSLSNAVNDESFVSDWDTGVNLAHTGISSAPVTVTSADGLTTYVEDVDYQINRERGTVTALSTGAMTDATTFRISYETVEATVLAVNPAGSDGKIMRQLMHNETVQINTSGQEAFREGIDIFQTLADLKNALVRGDRDDARAAAANLQEGRDQVNRFAGINALKYARMNEAEEELDALKLHLENRRASIEDADMTETAIKYQALEATYEASLQAGSKIMQLSLLDFLQ